MAAVTNAQILAAIAAIGQRVAALEGAPIVAAPEKAQATNTFFEDVIVARARAKVPCGIPAHGKSCNRKFGPTSSGVTNHTARIEK